jgi:hypothetical protein
VHWPARFGDHWFGIKLKEIADGCDAKNIFFANIFNFY